MGKKFDINIIMQRDAVTESRRLKSMLNGKTILVTGGTGSFGNQFVTYVLENYDPKKIIIYGIPIVNSIILLLFK